jgi:hypothetical protein
MSIAKLPISRLALFNPHEMSVRHYWFDVVRFRGEACTLVKRKHERGLTISFVLW